MLCLLFLNEIVWIFGIYLFIFYYVSVFGKFIWKKKNTPYVYSLVDNNDGDDGYIINTRTTTMFFLCASFIVNLHIHYWIQSQGEKK